MKIQNIFQEDINRSINGVIKVDQSAADVIEQEVREYVITKELRKHFAAFFNFYSESFTVPTHDIGVWISGFFGSGKSHFLKMLSYILENKPVGSSTTVDMFRQKFADDPAAFLPIDQSTKGTTETILFNIDVAGLNKDKDAVKRVFAKMFYNHLGYFGENLEVVQLEQYLAGTGKLEAFRQAFAQSSGKRWEDSRRNYKFVAKHVRTALVQALGMSEEDAVRCTQGKQTVELSVESLVQDIKNFVDSKPADYRLLFMIDEVGQYVGTDTSLLLNLQSLAENIGSVCQGKVWIICTGQEAIDEIIKVRSDEFSRIQARFKTRLSLSSSSVDEVIQKRVLKKTPAAEQELESVYGVNAATLRNLFTFKDAQADIKGFASAADFAINFPFIPYQFIIMQKVFAEIRRHGNSGKHLSGGERSMLSGFQEAAQKVQEGDENTLVPFFRFYDTVHSFLDSTIRQVIERADRAAQSADILKPYDVDVLKLLYLIRYIDNDIPANIDNIVILMADDIHADKITMRQQVRESLDRLHSQNYIGRSGENYNFLTNEEQDIQRAIRNETSVDTATIVERISQMIYADIYSTRKFRYNKDYDFEFDRYVDGSAVGNTTGGMCLRFLTVATDAADKDPMKLMTDSVNQAIAVLPETDYFTSLEQAEKIRKYIKQRNVSVLAKSTQDIIRAQQEEASRLDAAAKEELTKAILAADFYVAGERITERAVDAKGKIELALRYLVGNLYHELDQMEVLAGSEADISMILTGNAGNLQGLEDNQGALALVEDYLTMQHARNLPTSMHDIRSRFSDSPYGWREVDIAALVARLVVAQKATVKYQGNTIPASHPKLLDMLLKKTEIGRTQISKREVISASKIKDTRDFLREYLDVMDVPSKEDDLVAFIIEQFSAQREELRKMAALYSGQAYPDRPKVEAALLLVNDVLGQKADNIALINFIVKKQDALLDSKDNLHRVEEFFKNQRPVFDAAVKILLSLKYDKDYLNDVPEAEVALASMQDICFMQPGQKFNYQRIPELNSLISTVQSIHTDMLAAKREELLETVRQCMSDVHSAAGTDSRFRDVIAQSDRYYQQKKADIAGYATLTLLDGLTAQLAKVKDEALERIEEISRPLPPKPEPKPVSGDKPQPTPKPVPQKKYRVLNRAVAFPTRKLETPADVDAYVESLRASLKKCLAECDGVIIK